MSEAVSAIKRPRPPAAPHAFDLPGDTAATPEQKVRLAELNARYGSLGGADLLRAMIAEFPGRLAVVSSFGSESVVLLHQLASVDPTVPVLFLNTGKLFGETLRYRDRLQEVLGLTDVRAIGPHPDDLKGRDPEGTLWAGDPNSCCLIRKVLPLRRALTSFDAQVTGRKRFQTAARTAMAPIELSDGKFKINPLANWDQATLERYIDEHKLPAHPLVKDGYLSIGCMPCTSRVREGDAYRSGRWAGLDKEECGIHEPLLQDGDGI